MFVGAIGRGAQRIIDAMVRWLAYGHINPNFLTVIGVAINVGSGLLFGYGYFSGPALSWLLPISLTCSTARWRGSQEGSRVWRISRLLARSAFRHGSFCGLNGLLCSGHAVSLDPERFPRGSRTNGVNYGKLRERQGRESY